MRNTLSIALLALAAASQAVVVYSLATPADDYSFSLDTPTAVTSARTFTGAQIDSGHYRDQVLRAVDLAPRDQVPGFAFGDYVTLTGNTASDVVGWVFEAGAFSANGVYSNIGPVFGTTTPATLTVSGVPEPATLAALGLGAVGLLRRRARRS